MRPLFELDHGATSRLEDLATISAGLAAAVVIAALLALLVGA